MKKKIFAVTMILALVFTFCACDSQNGEQTTRVWKFAHSGFEGDPLYAYGEFLKTAIEEEFDDVILEIHPSEELGNDDERFELAQSGGVEIAMIASCFVGNTVPEAEVFGLSYMIPHDEEAANKILSDGKAINKLNEKMHDLGVTVMDWFYEDWSCWSCNEPIRKLEDMKGKKIRCMSTSMVIANLKGTGAIPTPITFSEVYSALQLGTVQGQGNPLATMVSKKFYEVQDYVVLSYHENVVDGMVCNNTFYDSLTADEQIRLQSCFKKANEQASAVRNQMSEDALQVMKDAGLEIIELSDEEMEKFKATSAYAQGEFIKAAGEPGKIILDLLLEDIETYTK